MFLSFTELEVLKECRKLRQQIALLVKKFPSEEKYRLTDQLIRASRSPCANIAEGHGRFHYQENIQFCRIARGSVYEIHNHLTDALDNHFIIQEESILYVKQTSVCIRLLNGYIAYLEKQKGSKN